MTANTDTDKPRAPRWFAWYVTERSLGGLIDASCGATIALAVTSHAWASLVVAVIGAALLPVWVFAFRRERAAR